MKEKFIILKALQASPLELAKIRSLLATHSYIEIENTFVISCSKSFKNTFSKQLTDENIRYLLVYVNNKAGADVFANGVNDQDLENIGNIVRDK